MEKEMNNERKHKNKSLTEEDIGTRASINCLREVEICEDRDRMETC